MRELGQKTNDLHRMQAWAGQAAALAREEPAGDFARRLWKDAEDLLPPAFKQAAQTRTVGAG
jgi:nitronate monooxygenase